MYARYIQQRYIMLKIITLYKYNIVTYVVKVNYIANFGPIFKIKIIRKCVGYQISCQAESQSRSAEVIYFKLVAN